MSTLIQRQKEARMLRKRRVRAKVSGTADKPRLSVYRSAGHIYAQLIDDNAGQTVLSASDLEMEKKDIEAVAKGSEDRKAKVAVAFVIGKMLGEKSVKQGIKAVVFDRNGFNYRGRIAALADGARAGGLEF